MWTTGVWVECVSERLVLRVFDQTLLQEPGDTAFVWEASMRCFADIG